MFKLRKKAIYASRRLHPSSQEHLLTTNKLAAAMILDGHYHPLSDLNGKIDI